MPSVIQAARFSDAIRRAFAVQGGFGLSVIDDVFPVVDLYSSRLEGRFLRGEYLVSAARAGTAAAAQFPTVHVGNPLGSGWLLIIERFRVTSSAAGDFSWRDQLGPLPGAPVIVNSDDERFTGSAVPFNQVFESAVASFGRSRGGAVAANLGTVFQAQVILPPGFRVEAQLQVAAATAWVHAEGYGYRATPEELRPT